MSICNLESYETLGWIIRESENGFFLVVANEKIQEEIIEIYQGGTVGIYDYKQFPGEYSFHKFREYIEKEPKIKTYFIANLQLEVQSEDGLKRLNFSRDMLAALDKNLIFITTPYGDNLLAKGAYDLYSFFKMRIDFEGYEKNGKHLSEEIPKEWKELLESEGSNLEPKKKIELTKKCLRRQRKQRKLLNTRSASFC